MPKPQLWIGPTRYKCETVRPDNELHKSSDEQAWATVNVDTKEVFLAETDVGQMREVAIHEIGHMLCKHTVLGTLIKGATKEERAANEELLCECMGRELRWCFERSRWAHDGKELLPRY